jgi:hypothetical protein
MKVYSDFRRPSHFTKIQRAIVLLKTRFESRSPNWTVYRISCHMRRIPPLNIPPEWASQARYLARMEWRMSAHRILVMKPKRKRRLEDLGPDGVEY